MYPRQIRRLIRDFFIEDVALAWEYANRWIDMFMPMSIHNIRWIVTMMMMAVVIIIVRSIIGLRDCMVCWMMFLMINAIEIIIVTIGIWLVISISIILGRCVITVNVIRNWIRSTLYTKCNWKNYYNYCFHTSTNFEILFNHKKPYKMIKLKGISLCSTLMYRKCLNETILSCPLFICFWTLGNLVFFREIYCVNWFIN